MRKKLLLSVRFYEIGVGVVAGTYFFGINAVEVLCTYKVSLAILLEKGGNLALLLDTRKADARRNSNFARFEKTDARKC